MINGIPRTRITFVVRRVSRFAWCQ
jgi:hypothetical protein